MDLDSFLDVPYVELSARDKYRELDIYLPNNHDNDASRLPPLVVFVHGGAWRSEDKADHGDLARCIAGATNCPVAVINYRLTPRDPPLDGSHFMHPGHSEDTLNALLFLQTWSGPFPERPHIYDPASMYLIGHSCSAHMLMSIFMDSSSVTPSLEPPTSLVRAAKGIIVSEGIYDLELLLTSFPVYRDWFIAAAFGSQQLLKNFSVTEFVPHNPDTRWLVIHSSGDTLIDVAQSNAVTKHLRKHVKDADMQLITNFDQLTEEHNEILHTKKYVDIIRGFVLEKN